MGQGYNDPRRFSKKTSGDEKSTPRNVDQGIGFPRHNGRGLKRHGTLLPCSSGMREELAAQCCGDAPTEWGGYIEGKGEGGG